MGDRAAADAGSTEHAATVVLVDDHELVRDGVRGILAAEPDLCVVGEAATGAEALARIHTTQPDVAVVDINLPDVNGIEVCREVPGRSPRTRVMILTSYADDEALFDAVLAGAAGYVLKHVRAAQLVECVRRVARGESLLDHAATERIRERVRAEHPNARLAALTEQERRALELLADGLTNAEIAEAMFLSDKTVKNYVSSLLSKLGMTRRTEAAAFAARLAERHDAIRSPASTFRPVRY